mgnify:CR=1 FL=1
MKTKILKVKITFLEPVLGTWPSNQNVARDFIASKSPDAATIEDEVAALGADAVADKGMTVFPPQRERRAGALRLPDQGILQGFLRYAGPRGRQNRNGQEAGRQRERQDLCLQEGHRRPDLPAAPHDPPSRSTARSATASAPLRAQTPGERVSLANSEEIPAGSTCEFEILLMDESLENAVLEWLDYGVFARHRPVEKQRQGPLHL